MLVISYQEYFYIEEKGLTIGGYKSTWLANLAISFLLETNNSTILEQLK